MKKVPPPLETNFQTEGSPIKTPITKIKEIPFYGTPKSLYNKQGNNPSPSPTVKGEKPSSPNKKTDTFYSSPYSLKNQNSGQKSARFFSIQPVILSLYFI